ncbi:MAG: phosphatase PAP2 family protein [Clostridia bacterium]|nr:phosphatase PAP2 family protein [Clostridia bacterium]
MKYNYSSLYNRNAAFLEKRQGVKKALLLFNTVIPYFFMLAYVLLFVYGATKGKFETTDFVKIFCSPAFALLFVSVLRLAIDRARPYSEDGAGIVPLKEKEGDRSSFPSRHLTCAAVIATTFLPYIPAVGCLLFVLGLGLGYARFAIGWHYPSDLFAGFALGVVVGLIPVFI